MKRELQDYNWATLDEATKNWAREVYNEFLNYKNNRSFISRLRDLIFGSVYVLAEVLEKEFGKQNIIGSKRENLFSLSPQDVETVRYILAVRQYQLSNYISLVENEENFTPTSDYRNYIKELKNIKPILERIHQYQYGRNNK